MSVGARVNSLGKAQSVADGRASFGGWSHMVNLVTIRGETFVVDVGVSTSCTGEDMVRVSADQVPNSSVPAVRLVRWP
jgi:hypothetical protein